MRFMHNGMFYPKLALTNMRKNASIYLPYLMAGGVMAALLYILDSVGVMAAASQMAGKSNMVLIVGICRDVCTIFVVLTLFYINSFVMKRRKKEFGLFCVLGMEKKHLGAVLFWEVLISMTVSLLAGIAIGALFSQAMFLLLLKLVELPGMLMFTIPLQSVGNTCLIYIIAYAVVLVYDLASVSRANPIELLRSSAEGEREPQSRWPMVILGTVTLAVGYGLAFKTRSAYDAMSSFFPAVLLVMVGTYCLFQAGSVVVLKKLRNKKDFYYKPENFVAVSGMIYRMKQNAAGLAGICILSAAVLITLSTCMSLYVGEEDILKKQYPRDYNLYADAEQEAEDIQSAINRLVAEYRCELLNPMEFYYLSFRAKTESNRITPVRTYYTGTFVTYVMSLADYNQIQGEDRRLNPGEAMYYAPSHMLNDSVAINGQDYRTVRRLEESDVTQLPGFATYRDQILLIVPERSDLHHIASSGVNLLGAKEFPQTVRYQYLFDLAGSQEGKAGFEEAFRNKIPGLSSGVSRNQKRAGFYQLYGSILFVGIFFIALFLTATVLIIYYKQITEGYDDRERFKIMEKVGMSAAEVKRTIAQQVKMVFFLPLGVAVLHIAVAFPAMCSMLTAFQMYQTRLFAVFTVVSVLVFGAIYLFVYRLTARTYLKIVRE